MVEELDLRSPRVDPGLILRLQKYKNPDRVSPVVKEAARKMALLAETLVEPRGWLRRTPVKSVGPEGRVQVADGLEFHSRSLERLLQDATEVTLVILTIGPALEARAQELVKEEQMAEGLLLDTAGWVAIDALIKEARKRLEADAWAGGLRVTARMAPGFKDWPLEQQRALFDALTGANLSVHLTDACVMVPSKSVSGVYGLVPVARG